MGLACLFGHKWDWCKCSKCGKIRDTNHNWENGRCLYCGKFHNNHIYQPIGKCLERCEICGKENETTHNFVNSKKDCTTECTVCGKLNANHTFEQIKVIDYKKYEIYAKTNGYSLANEAMFRTIKNGRICIKCGFDRMSVMGTEYCPKCGCNEMKTYHAFNSSDDSRDRGKYVTYCPACNYHNTTT